MAKPLLRETVKELFFGLRLWRYTWNKWLSEFCDDLDKYTETDTVSVPVSKLYGLRLAGTILREDLKSLLKKMHSAVDRITAMERKEQDMDAVLHDKLEQILKEVRSGINA